MLNPYEGLKCISLKVLIWIGNTTPLYSTLLKEQHSGTLPREASKKAFQGELSSHDSHASHNTSDGSHITKTSADFYLDFAWNAAFGIYMLFEHYYMCMY